MLTPLLRRALRQEVTPVTSAVCQQEKILKPKGPGCL
jgi:hypothetical protein